MLRLDRPHRAARGPHDDALRPAPAPALEPHAAEEVAVGDARRGEKDVVAAAEVVGEEDARQVVAQRQRPLALAKLLAGREPPLDRAAEALERRGGDDALGRAADPQHDVDGAAWPSRFDRCSHVAVGNEADAGARCAHLPDELRVPRAVEDADLVFFFSFFFEGGKRFLF